MRKHGKVARVDGRYAWYVLAVLTIVNIYNTMDRYSLSILAEDVKHSFAISDSELGFLTGTAFAIFYALFGYPVARLADRWRRVSLLTIGLSFWSIMTVASGFASSLVEMSIFRLGIGMGEAAVSPVGYSLLSDWFSKQKRGTALGYFGSGIYVGMGLSLFLGGLIVYHWKQLFPVVKPFGFEGWQITFFAFGLPGLLLAFWVSTFREPTRGQADGVERPAPEKIWRPLFLDFCAVLPPLTFYDAARRGGRALAANVLLAAGIAMVVGVLIKLSGDWMQWAAVGFGLYAACSAASSLRHNDRPTFALTWGTPTFMWATVGFGAATTINTVLIIWSAPLAVRTLGLDPKTVGLLLGAITAIGGAIGGIAGGRISDILLKRSPLGRLWVGIGACVIPLPFSIAMCFAHNATAFFLYAVPAAVIGKAWIAPGAATIQDLVLPRMRGTATNIYFLFATLVGSGLAPYAVGKISVVTHDLATGLWTVLTVTVAVAAFSMWRCGQRIEQAEATKEVRALVDDHN
jgi:MFS family permease